MEIKTGNIYLYKPPIDGFILEKVFVISIIKERCNVTRDLENKLNSFYVDSCELKAID